MQFIEKQQIQKLDHLKYCTKVPKNYVLINEQVFNLVLITS